MKGKRTLTRFLALFTIGLPLVALVSALCGLYAARAADQPKDFKGTVARGEDTLMLQPGFRAEKQADGAVRIYGGGGQEAKFNCSCSVAGSGFCELVIYDDRIRCEGSVLACEGTCKFSRGAKTTIAP